MAEFKDSFEAAGDHLREGETSTYDAMTRRGLENRLIEGADVAIDLGSGDNPDTRFVAMSMDSESPEFTIKEIDSDIVDLALCRDNVHTLNEVSFGQNNQFAPVFQSFVDTVQLAELPDQVSRNISAAMSDENPEQAVAADKVAQDLSGVCSP